MLDKNSPIKKLSDNISLRTDLDDSALKMMVKFINPHPLNHCYFENKSLGLSIGTCNAHASNTRTRSDPTEPHPYNEFLTIIEGTAKIKQHRPNKQRAHSTTISTGESFIIPQGNCFDYQQASYLHQFYIRFTASTKIDPAIEEKIICLGNQAELNSGAQNNIPWQQTSDGYRKKIIYQNKNKSFTCGIWQGNTFTTRMITFPYNEFIHIDQGSLVCIDSEGLTHTFNLGDAVFIPQGTRCSWQVSDKISLTFVQVS